MILDAFGDDAVPLLVAGALGGMVRGLIVLRGVIAKGGPVTRQVLINTLFDTGTSIVIGACISLFLHGFAETLTDPLLNFTTADAATKTLTSGFVAGFGCIAISGVLWDFLSGLRKKPPDPPQAVANPAGNP